MCFCSCFWEIVYHVSPPPQLLFSMIVGMVPFCRGSCQRSFPCDVYSLHFESPSVIVNNINLIVLVFFGLF